MAPQDSTTTTTHTVSSSSSSSSSSSATSATSSPSQHQHECQHQHEHAHVACPTRQETEREQRRGVSGKGVHGSKASSAWPTVMKFSPAGRDPMEEWQISQGRKHLAGGTQEAEEEEEEETEPTAIPTPEVDLLGTGLAIILPTEPEKADSASETSSSPWCSSESWCSLSSGGPLPSRSNSDNDDDIDIDDDEDDDSSYYYMCRGDISHSDGSDSSGGSFFHQRRDIPREMARQRQRGRVSQLESRMPTEALRRMDEVFAGEAYVRDFVRRKYESHWNSVTFTPGVTTSRLCEIGRVDRSQGIAACKQLLRIPVIHEEVTLALYEELADLAAQDLIPFAEHPDTDADTVTQEDFAGRESTDTVVASNNESRRCSDATTLVGSGKTDCGRRSSAALSSTSASSTGKAKSKDKKKRSGKNHAKHSCASCPDGQNGLCSDAAHYHHQEENAAASKKRPGIMPGKNQEAKNTPAADGFWSAPEPRSIRETYDENRDSPFVIPQNVHRKDEKDTKGLGKSVLKEIGKACRHISRKAGRRADSDDTSTSTIRA